MHSQQRRARRNREPKHVHALHVSPKRVFQWSYSHSPKKEHITKGFFWHHPSRSCQRAPSSRPERASPLVIPSIFNCLRSGRVLTRDVYVIPLLCLPTIFSLWGDTWHFPEPREREQSTVFTACCFTALPSRRGGGCCLVDPFSPEKEHTA